MAKNLDGHGSIWKMKTRDLYKGTIQLKLPNGTKIRPSFYGKNRTEVKAKFAKERQRVELLAEGIELSNEPLADFLHRFARLDEDVVKPGTIQARLERIDAYIIPSIGHIKLKDLTFRDIEVLYADLRKRKYQNNNNGAVTRANVSATLGAALKIALKQGLIDTDPMLRVAHHPPHNKDSKANPLELDEYKKLISIDDEYKQFWIIMVGTMMRIGEAMALHWSDVNLEKNYVSITKQFHYVFGRPTVEAPKSKSSIRRVYFGENVHSAFRVWKGQQLLDNRNEDDLVFPNSVGKIHGGQMFRNILKARLEHLGIEPRRIHDLRATGATFASAEGTEIKSLHVTLGHKDMDTTYNYYNKPQAETLSKESTKLDAILG